MLKKLLVLGSVLSALVLTGAGCVRNNAAVVPAQNNTQTESSSASPAGGLPESQSTASQPITSKPPVSQPVVPKPETRQVTIASFAFGPASITVKAGTIVKWVNDDEVVHSIKSGNGGFTSSGNLNTGNSYEFKFVNPGVYDYSCGLHPSMRGTVVVQ